MEQLKPCPFCGATPRAIAKGDGPYKNSTYPDYKPDPEVRGWDIECETDGCYLEDGADFWLTRDEVVTKWNKRA